MKHFLPRWLLALSIQWKLQLGFFLVAVVTIIIDRSGGYGELKNMVNAAKEHGVSMEVLVELNNRLTAYITASIWQSILELVILFLGVTLLAKFFIMPILNLRRAWTAVEKGDLTQTVEYQSLDEFGILEHSFNTTLANLTSVIRSIDDNSKQMAQSAYQVATISHEIATLSKNEQRRSREVNSATTQLRDVSASVEKIAEEANTYAAQTEKSAQEGILSVEHNIREMDNTVHEVNRAAQEMTELKNASLQIYNIIGTIRTIAEQTNLLALNAAIEAARAGEAGRGFAVVADEVRGLAMRTTDSTTEISAIINELKIRMERTAETMVAVVDGVNGSQETARDTSRVIKQIVQEISVSVEANNRISTVSRTQMENIAFLQESLDRLFEALKENSAKVETTATIGDDLYRVSENLKNVLAQFNFEHDVAAESTTHEKRRSPRLERPLRVNAAQKGRSYESISRDFSMTGMQLRTKDRLDTGTKLEISVFLPCDNLSAYEHQVPLKLMGSIIWQKSEGSGYAYGVKYDQLNPSQRQQLQGCFRYFNRQHEYAPSATRFVEV